MAKSTGKRENGLTPNEQQLDGMFMGPDSIAQSPSSDPIHYTNAVPPNDPKEGQNTESSSTDGDLPKGQQNNKRNDGTTFDKVVVYILPTP